MRIYPAIFLVLGLTTLVIDIVLGKVPKTLSGQTLLPDYLAHWTGGRLLLNGDLGHLYDPSVQHGLQNEVIGSSTQLSWFVSPPFAAVLYAPFALLSYPVSAGMWTVASTGLLVAAIVMMRPMLPRLGLRHWGLVTLVVAATQPVLELIGSGQDSALSLFLWVLGVRLLTSNRDRSAGVVFALGLLKPQLFIVAPLVLLLQCRFRALGAWVVTASGLGLVSLALVGPSGIHTWLSLPFTRLYQVQVQEGQAWKMEGLPSLVTSLAPPAMAATAQVTGLIVAVLVAAAFALEVRRSRGASIQAVWAFAAITTVVVSPHLVIYDLVLALPAFLYLLERHNQRVTRLSLLLLFGITWTTALRHVAAGHLAWPFSVVGAAWSVVPLAVLWSLLCRDFRSSRASTPSPIATAQESESSQRTEPLAGLVPLVDQQVETQEVGERPVTERLGLPVAPDRHETVGPGDMK
jgi:hypothetical protein